MICKSKFIIPAILAAGIAATANAKDLVIGKQDQDAKVGTKLFGPMAESLSKALGVKVTIKTYRFPSQMDAEVQSGAVDISIDTPYNALFVDTKDKMEGIANIWKKGVEYQQGCFVTLAGKSVDLKNLKGKKVVLEEPFSTGSFALPIATLLKTHKIDDFQLISAEDAKKAGGASALEGYKNFKLDASKVGVVFSMSDEDKSPEFLKLGDDFAVAGMACKTGEELKLNAVEKTKEVPRNVFNVQRSMDAETKKKILAAITTWGKESPELAPLKGTAVKELNADQKKMIADSAKDFKAGMDWVIKNGLSK